jgi:hypothetical protein
MDSQVAGREERDPAEGRPRQAGTASDGRAADGDTGGRSYANRPAAEKTPAGASVAEGAQVLRKQFGGATFGKPGARLGGSGGSNVGSRTGKHGRIAHDVHNSRVKTRFGLRISSAVSHGQTDSVTARCFALANAGQIAAAEMA